MRLGQGDPKLPSWENETSGYYVWRLAKFQGRPVGPEPEAEIKDAPQMGLPLRDPGEEG